MKEIQEENDKKKTAALKKTRTELADKELQEREMEKGEISQILEEIHSA